MQPDATLSIEGVSKTYWLDASTGGRLLRLLAGHAAGARPVNALRHVSFDARRGEAIALLGLNGSGKSTLLGIIAGTTPPSDGVARIQGRVASLLELGVGFNPERSGRDNALLTLALAGIYGAEAEGLLPEIEALADIGEFVDLPVKTYSTGMFLRLGFAAQAVLEPDIWIVDEALGVGDFGFRQRALARLRQFIERGGTLLLATHDTTLADAFCSRALVLDHGELVYDGPIARGTQMYITRYSQPGVIGDNAHLPALPIQHGSSEDLAQFLAAALPRPPDSDYLGKAVELLGVSVQDEYDRQCNVFRTGQTLRVRTAFLVKEPRPHVTNTLVLHHDSGLMVWGAGIVNARRLLRVQDGMVYLTTIDVTLELQPGIYHLTVGLATANLENSARVAEFHDRFSRVASIQVVDTTEERQGIARLPYSVLPVEVA